MGNIDFLAPSQHRLTEWSHTGLVIMNHKQRDVGWNMTTWEQSLITVFTFFVKRNGLDRLFIGFTCLDRTEIKIINIFSLKDILKLNVLSY